MAPKYMADKTFGLSLYNSDFNGSQVYEPHYTFPAYTIEIRSL